MAFRVRAYFRVLYTENSAIPNSVVLDKLPARERKELAIALDYLPGSATQAGVVKTSGFTHRMSFFQDLSWWDIVIVCQKFKIMQLKQATLDDSGAPFPESDDLIIPQGEVEYEMYVVMDGSCMALQNKLEVGRARKV